MLTVRSLVEDCGLELAAGETSADKPVRWVHISEHEDPTPWISGGELLLTTGYNLGTPARQRRYVGLLAGEGVAGLGFGIGFDHKRLPKAIVEASVEHDLPLFEVPYEMPFIAITERASARLINEQFGVLERAVQVHERLERLVIEGEGLDEVLGATGSRHRRRRRGAGPVRARAGAAAPRARTTRPWRPSAPSSRSAARGAHRELRPRGGPLADRALAVPVPGRRGGVAGRVARGHRRARRARGLRAPLRPPGGDRRRPRAHARADRAGDRAAARRRPAGRRAGRRAWTPRSSRGRLRPFGIGARGRGAGLRARGPARRGGDARVGARGCRRPGAGSDQRRGRPAAALRGRSTRPSAEPIGTARLARAALTGGTGRNRVAPPPRAPPASARCAGRFTRPAARSRRRRSPTATPPRSRRTRTSAPSPCCSPSRTTTLCASTATGSWSRSSAPRASTAASSCGRSRHSSRTTATGSGRRASSTATVTRCATGSGRSRSSPAGI